MSYRNLAQGRDVLDTKIKWTIVGLAFLTVIVLGVLMVHRAAFSTELNSDFITYRAAGWAVLTGSDIYKVQNPRGWPYVYPPPFAILMTPFAKMSAFTASVIWYLLSVILVVSSVQMAVTMVRGALGRFGRNPFWLYALPFVMVLLWVGQGAVEGQATILTLWLLMLAIYRSQRGRDISSGTALACAALLKAFPVAMLAHFIREKRWRLVMATMTALIVGGIALPALVYGWQRNLTYWQEWIAVVAQPSLGDRTLGLQREVTDRVLSPDNPRNQALQAVLWRLGVDQARFLTAAIGLMMALAMLVVARRTQWQHDLLIAAAWLVWLLVIAPVSHFHYHMLVLLPMTVLAFLALVNIDSLLTTLARVTLVVYLLVSVCTLALPRLQYIGLLCWTTLGLWAVLLFVAARCDTQAEALTQG
jgi:Glycosyltransferase family 87